jgi:large subunit ribosomal protein L15e
MGMYKHLSRTWQDNPAVAGLLKERMIEFRKQPVIAVLARPSRVDKARRLGYKAKQGFAVARVRLLKGGRSRRAIARGRKPSKFGLKHFSTTLSLRAVAEQRASRKFPNMEVLNSYYVAEDGKYVWHEVILVDRAHPSILNDRKIAWIAHTRGRAFRGLTAAARRSRRARRTARY